MLMGKFQFCFITAISQESVWSFSSIPFALQQRLMVRNNGWRGNLGQSKVYFGWQKASSFLWLSETLSLCKSQTAWFKACNNSWKCLVSILKLLFCSVLWLTGKPGLWLFWCVVGGGKDCLEQQCVMRQCHAGWSQDLKACKNSGEHALMLLLVVVASSKQIGSY